MTVPQVANRLRDELDFGYPLAFAIAATNGHCAYCGMDLLEDPSVGYAVDHLLPKSKYPDYEDVPENWAWSCTGCNAFKFDFDPLLPGQKPNMVLGRSRGELVEGQRPASTARRPRARGCGGKGRGRSSGESRLMVDRAAAPEEV